VPAGFVNLARLSLDERFALVVLAFIHTFEGSWVGHATPYVGGLDTAAARQPKLLDLKASTAVPNPALVVVEYVLVYNV
jgi:hypothetical protein